MTSSINPIFRFCGVPVGTAFVIFGIHEFLHLWEGIFGIIFQILDILNLHKTKTEIVCTRLPLLEEHIIHPHEYVGNSQISWAEDFLYSLVSTTVILIYWIGFIFKGSKYCLGLWLVLSSIILFLRIRYVLYGDNPVTEDIEMYKLYWWRSFQILITCFRHLYLSTLSLLFIRFCYTNSEDLVHEDLKPLGMGIRGFFKYYSQHLKEALLAVGIAAILDVAFMYFSGMPANVILNDDFWEAIIMVIGFEVVPYVLLIAGLCQGSIKWIEYWRAAFLSVCFIWSLLFIVSMIVTTSTCDAIYFLNWDNFLNYFILFYMIIYKCSLYRISLLYVKKNRNIPIEMTDLNPENGFISNVEIVYDSRTPFVNYYDT